MKSSVGESQGTSAFSGGWVGKEELVIEREKLLERKEEKITN